MRAGLFVLTFSALLSAQTSSNVVISQIYGGGGNAGAPLRHDYIELFNQSRDTVSVNGWSVQYSSAAGTDWQVTPISGSIPPGRYLLVREAEGANTAATPISSPDVSGTIAMSATTAKVALVRSSSPLTGGRPVSADIADLVGYGDAASVTAFEGSAPVRALSNTTAAIRRGAGCIDSNDNAADFQTGSPAPRTSADPAVNCDAPMQTSDLRISEIQGSGDVSPYVGQTVRTRGVVTGTSNNGLWIQSLPSDDDNNPATSEGLFVFFAATPPGSTGRGYYVQVTGTVSEFRPAADPGSPTLTELVDPRLEVLSQGQPLPAPVVLTPAVDWERYEGMLVSVPMLQTVSGTLGSLQETTQTATSNGIFYGILPGQPRPYRTADPNESVGKIRVDTRAQGGPVLDVSSGATVTNLMGPLDFGFRTYTVVQDPSTNAVVSGGISPLPAPVPLAGEFTIAAANLERFFDTMDDPATADPVLTPAALQLRLTKTSRVIRQYLQSPDVLAVEEVENLDLLRSLASVSGDYEASLFPGNDIGGINVGLLTKRGTVQVLSVSQEGKDTPLGSDKLWDRPPLVARLSVQGVPVTAIVVHLRSLLNADTATVAAKRQAQAEALRGIIASRVQAGEQVVVLGDFNTFQFDPLMTVIRSGGNLTNLTDTLPPNENYSYVQDGVTQTLDHLLITEGLRSRISRYQVVHVDADFAEVFHGDAGRTERVSDHDFPIAYFNVAPATVQLVKAGVTNAATFLSGPVAPLEIVTIFGRDLGPAVLASFSGDGLSTSLAGTRVFFDADPAPLIYTSVNQVSAVVPASVAGKSTVTVQVEFQGRRTNPVSLPVKNAAPGIFSLDRNGKGQGAILNQNSSVNGTGNPAERGSIIQIFGTGNDPASPPVVRIGGKPAQVFYSGQAPGLVQGVLQVNAMIPADVTPGNAPVVLNWGDRTSALDLTVAVR